MVSVCIPSYNHARFLPATLDSILGQTFRDFELIVVDDGSTDNSLEILESYARKYPESMRVLTHPGGLNLGISVTCNLAIKEARGVYWCVHASDDVSYPDRLERQVAFLESHPDVGWVYGVADCIDKNGTRFDGQFGRDLSAFPDLVEELIFSNGIAGPTTMVRMKCVNKVGQNEPGLMYSDWEFWIRLAAHYSAAFLPGAVAAYRVHDYNTSVLIPQCATPERILKGRRWRLEVLTALRWKADVAECRLGRPHTKALIDLMRAAALIGLKDRASRAAADVFRSDPSFGDDLKRLAYYLYRLKSLRLALMMIRELGYPPKWLLDTDFMSALLRLGARGIRYRFIALGGKLQGVLSKALV
jgi:glycosyltransferase involved in cell wall biosynthesis